MLSVVLERSTNESVYRPIHDVAGALVVEATDIAHGRSGSGILHVMNLEEGAIEREKVWVNLAAIMQQLA
jgi:hypothetical protein